MRSALFIAVLVLTVAPLGAGQKQSAKHYAVYEPELARVWPDGENRQAQIASFAKKHGWRLRHYSHGFCAIFDKEPSR